MGKLLVTVGSITTAARLEKLIRREIGKNAAVIHTPGRISGGGCSYSVRTDIGSLPYIKEILKENKIRARGFYMENYVEGEKEYHAIS